MITLKVNVLLAQCTESDSDLIKGFALVELHDGVGSGSARSRRVKVVCVRCGRLRTRI